MTLPLLLFNKKGKAKSYAQKIDALFGSNLIAYWPLSETSGSVANDVSGNSRNGIYTGITLANTPAPAKTKTLAPYFDGTNGFIDIYSASLGSAFNAAGPLGSAFLWLKVANSGIWTDGLFHIALRVYSDGNNYIQLQKLNTNNIFELRYASGGFVKGISTSPMSSTNWFLAWITWSKAADEMKAYVDNAQVGATQTALGTWNGTLFDTLRNNIGCGLNSPVTTPWTGWEAHCFLLNRVATLAEGQRVYDLGV